MGRKRPERTERRSRERAARRLVRDRERLALLEPGGSAEHPIEVVSPAVIEVRVASLECPQCQGGYILDDHQSGGDGLRVVDVTCRLCHVSRQIWFRLGSPEPN
jgi:predicted Zn finger-like uncharacterized protein